MYYWGILGIAPTKDKTVIKKAYAEQLKLHHPEDDPDGFQQVRKAYESALQYAKDIERDTATITDASIDEQNSEVHWNQYVYDESEVIIGTEANKATDELIEEFMKKVLVVYNSARLRKNRSRWKSLLENEAYWNLDLKKKLSYRLLSLLEEHYQQPKLRLPTLVWHLLNDHFFWMEQQKELYRSFSTDFVDHMVEEICKEPITLQRRIVNFTKKHLRIIYNIFWFIVTIAIIIAFFATGSKISVTVVYLILICVMSIWKNCR